MVRSVVGFRAVQGLGDAWFRSNELGFSTTFGSRGGSARLVVASIVNGHIR